MRPNKLIMTGFGPYAGRTEVNLDELGEKGVYLITGDTGAGKTTIFDAITFALYGKPSGKNRDEAMLRSKFADAKTPTEVELYFSNNGKKYYVKRNPSYERKKLRGEGVTPENSNAELHFLDDDKVVSGLKEVDASIKEILGVDREQFSQIAMLAQGAFLDMLFADTSKRAEIFRNIFKTRFYQTFQNRLSSDASELEKKIKVNKTEIKTFIEGAEAEENDVEVIELEKAKKGELLTEDVIKLLEVILDKDSKKSGELDKALTEKDEAIEKVNKLLEKGEGRKKTVAEITKGESELKNLEAPLKAAEEKLIKIKGEEIVVEENKKEATKLEQTLDEYEKREQNRGNIQKYSVVIKKSEDDLKNLEKEAENLEEEIKKMLEEKNSLSDVSEKINRLKSELKDLEVIKNVITKLEENIKALDIEKGLLKKLQEEFVKAQNTFKEANALYERKSEAYLAQQAGILAEALEEGQACPVCGSTNHPHLACKTSEAPTKEELQGYKDKAEELRDIAATSSDKANKKISAVENMKKNIISDAAEIFNGEADIDKLVKLLVEKKKDNSDEISVKSEELSKVVKSEARYKKLDQLIPENQERKNKIVEEKGEVSKTGAEAKANLDNAKVLEKSLSEKLVYASKADALKRISDLNYLIENYRQELKKAEELSLALKQKKDTLEGSVKTLKSNLEAMPSIDIDNCYEQLNLLKAEREEIRKKKEKVVSRVNANTKALKGISEKLSLVVSVEKKYQMIKNLSDTANGNLNGKDKIKLETYVQAFYFDRVVQRANVRFLEMTNGHYELKRAAGIGNKNSDRALDLSIIDHYTSTERSVKTLSGGESFEAALAMALAFSEEVTESAGGIKMDTLFVDEGFGSLDDVALVKAIKTLENLSEGNRLVGIISHVGELKKRIDKQIVVTKEKTGESKLEIVT